MHICMYICQTRPHRRDDVASVTMFRFVKKRVQTAHRATQFIIGLHNFFSDYKIIVPGYKGPVYLVAIGEYVY